MNDNQLRRLIILGFIGIALIVIGIFAFIQNNVAQSGQPKQTEWVDPASGDTVQDTENKTPEKYGVDPNQPTYLGFAELLDRGMLLSEVDNSKVFLNDFVDKQLHEGKEKITQISIEQGTVEHKIQTDAHLESFTMKLLANHTQHFTFDITIDSNKNQRSLSLKQDGVVVYSTEQMM